MKIIFYILIFSIFLFSVNNKYKNNFVYFKDKNSASCKYKSNVKFKDFIFKDIHNQSSKLCVSKNNYDFINIKQPIQIIFFFSSWCPPCLGQIPHLINIQKKYKNKVFIIGSLIYDDFLSNKKLNKFIKSQKIHLFISNNFKENSKFGTFISKKLNIKKEFNIPMIVMFVNGKYFTHYEGATLEEIMESDIKQALIQVKEY